jgi:hypothetical protein
LRTHTTLCLVFIITGLVLSEAGFATINAAREPVEKLNGVTCTPPKDFALLPRGENENALFMYDKHDRLGLFIAVPPAPFKEDELVSTLIDTGISKFFPKEPHTYVWKPSSDYQKISKFEVGGGKTQGFNKRQRVLVLYRHLVVDRKDVWVGYVAEFDRGKEAAQMFNVSLGGESMPGCNATVEMIFSITGEKISEGHFPCELIAIRPGSNR